MTNYVLVASLLEGYLVIDQLNLRTTEPQQKTNWTYVQLNHSRMFFRLHKAQISTTGVSWNIWQFGGRRASILSCSWAVSCSGVVRCVRNSSRVLPGTRLDESVARASSSEMRLSVEKVSVLLLLWLIAFSFSHSTMWRVVIVDPIMGVTSSK